MKRCLDTTFLCDLIRGRESALNRLEEWQKDGDDLLTTAFSQFELVLGILREESAQTGNRMSATWEQFARSLEVAPFSHSAAEIASTRQSELLRMGRAAPAIDLCIAVVAAANECDVIMTHDRRAFAAIGLVPVVGH